MNNVLFRFVLNLVTQGFISRDRFVLDFWTFMKDFVVFFKVIYDELLCNELCMHG